MENKLTSICGISIIGLAIYSQPIIDDASIGWVEISDDDDIWIEKPPIKSTVKYSGE